jgi:hypothetical protein
MAPTAFRTQLVVLLYAVLCGIGAGQTNEAEKKSALDLLDNAANLAQQFNVEERADITLAAADVAAPLDASRANAWAREAFDLTRQMPETQSRVPMQKNALRVLAVNDPDTALLLYRQQDVLKPSEYPEDPRALSVPSIINVVWNAKGRSYFKKLRSLAVYLGETGQYPYRPMADVAVDLAKSDRKQAQHIFADAICAFRHDPGFASSDSEFVGFITKTGGVAGRSILKREIRAAVDSLERQHPTVFSKVKFRIGVTTPVGDTVFNSESEYLLFRLLPFARIGDPKLAKRLLESHPPLRNVPAIGVNTPVRTAGAASLTGTNSDERMRFTLDRSRVFHVSQLAESDPKQARTMAEQINTADLQTMAFVLLAPAYSRLDSHQANAWLEEAEGTLTSVKDDAIKVGIMTALVRAYDLMGQQQTARARLATAFILGEKLYGEDRRQHQGTPTYSMKAFGALQQLAYELGRLEDTPHVKTRISQIPDMPLRASLLISAARALADAPPDPFLPV